MNTLSENNPPIKEALDELKNIAQDADIQWKIFEQEDWERRQKAAVLEGKAEGREEGKAEGREEGREEGHEAATLAIAKKMKADGLSLELIAKYTGMDMNTLRGL